MVSVYYVGNCESVNKGEVLDTAWENTMLLNREIM